VYELNALWDKDGKEEKEETGVYKLGKLPCIYGSIHQATASAIPTI